MSIRQDRAFEDNSMEIFERVIREVVTRVSSNVHRRYEIIDLDKVPEHVNYSKVEKYLRSVNIEITRKMFLSYLKEELLPGGHEVKNANYSYYTKEQIIYYIMIDMFKPILPLNKIKVLFDNILKPMIDAEGLESTYRTLYEIIHYMTQKFEEAVTLAIKENIPVMQEHGFGMTDEMKDDHAAAMYNIRQYTNLVTLCMARGALDFYKYSTNTLLE